MGGGQRNAAHSWLSKISIIQNKTSIKKKYWREEDGKKKQSGWKWKNPYLINEAGVRKRGKNCG
ncbi:MAG: hypothetical protein V8Q12_02660 [Agathobacter rectalis]